ncbi:heat-shock protein [Arcobacter sp. FWKO B]|uniref:heat-shock protein n=1 Tax=Arcobacter sp. FWKO B TaxID=2593672 RepID=UPI0018A4FBB5|nr:heat-shock protein [Arcobacter sp. FWKO B]QOG12487.1 heat-shock protein [Arcobacter sp. FWKO B]
MIDKKEFLLESIIKAYILNLEPIGSSQLKQMYDLEYSSATIRGYFKKLGDEGYLIQEHVSSGRIPSADALKDYWTFNLDYTNQAIDYQLLQRYAKHMGLSVALKQDLDATLEEVLEINKNYIFLKFQDFGITIKYTSAIYRFLQDMINLSVEQLLSVAKQVGAYELYSELSNKLQHSSYEIINIKEYLSLVLSYDISDSTVSSFLNGTIFDNLKDGLYFENLLPKGYMGVCSTSKINGKNTKMLVIGNLTKDYINFYERIAA